MNADFDASFAFAKNVSGWLTPAQADRLASAVRALPPSSIVVEIGSHHGKSAIVMAGARPDVRVHAVDPFVKSFGGQAVRRAFESNVSQARVSDRIELHPVSSHAALAQWSGPVDLLYIDGKHDARSCLQDLRWARHLGPDASIFVHDAFSSIGVTLAMLWSIVIRGSFEYVDRTGSLAQLHHHRATVAGRLRCLAQLPWWVRNVWIKVLLRLRLRRVAALFGHTDTSDPY